MQTTYALTHVIHKINRIFPPKFNIIVFSRSISWKLIVWGINKKNKGKICKWIKQTKKYNNKHVWTSQSIESLAKALDSK